MKRLLALALCAVLLCFAVVVPAMASYTMYVFTGNGKTLNLRDAPNSDTIIARIPFGAAVVVDEMVGVEPGWTHITYNGLSGFVMSRYLSSQKQPKPIITIEQNPMDSNDLVSMFKGFTQVTPYTATLYPKNAYAVLRWAPTKSAAIRQKYVKGQTVTVIAESNYWVQARDEETGKVGFIWKNFVSR